MDLYGENHLIETFTHRGSEVMVTRALKGRRHCGVQHAFDRHSCKKCGVKLRAKVVYLVYIDKQYQEGDHNDQNSAVEYAKISIDAAIDGPPTDPMPTEKTDTAKEPDATPPRKPNPERARIIATVKKLGWAQKLAAKARKENPPKK